jgi:hypothetical protein
MNPTLILLRADASMADQVWRFVDTHLNSKANIANDARSRPSVEEAIVDGNFFVFTDERTEIVGTGMLYNPTPDEVKFGAAHILENDTSGNPLRGSGIYDYLLLARLAQAALRYPNATALVDVILQGSSYNKITTKYQQYGFHRSDKLSKLDRDVFSADIGKYGENFIRLFLEKISSAERDKKSSSQENIHSQPILARGRDSAVRLRIAPDIIEQFSTIIEIAYAKAQCGSRS